MMGDAAVLALAESLGALVEHDLMGHPSVAGDPHWWALALQSWDALAALRLSLAAAGAPEQA